MRLKPAITRDVRSVLASGCHSKIRLLLLGFVLVSSVLIFAFAVDIDRDLTEEQLSPNNHFRIYYTTDCTNHKVVGVDQRERPYRSAPTHVVSATPKADPIPPSGYVLINDGAEWTDTEEVTLTIWADPDTVEMKISNDPRLTNATWEAFNTTKSWTLLPGEGLRTVYVLFKDAAGNIGPRSPYDPSGEIEPAMDSIILRRIPGAPPGPLSVSVSASATQVCGPEFSHELEVCWNITGGTPPYDATIEITAPDGRVEVYHEEALKGCRKFSLSYPGGGTTTVKIVVKDSAGATASASATASLAPCSGG